MGSFLMDSFPEPMLAGTIQSDHESWLKRNWIVQRKMDGNRCMVHLIDGRPVETRSRSGMPMDLPVGLYEDMPLLPGIDVVLDGEIAEGIYWMFDCLGGDLNGGKASMRQTLLEAFNAGWEDLPFIQMVETVVKGKTALPFIENLHGSGAEGVMLRNPESPYSPGRSPLALMKWKFIRYASVISMGDGTLHVQNDQGKLIEVGKVNPEHVPTERTVQAVEYLRLTKAGRLREARISSAIEPKEEEALFSTLDSTPITNSKEES